MATYTQNTDLNTTWNITTSNDEWILTKTATITTDGSYGVFVDEDYSLDTIRLFGDVSTSNETAVRIDGDDIDLIIGKNAIIEATTSNTGIAAFGDDADIINHGLVKSGSMGVVAGQGATVNNYGKVIAGYNGLVATNQDVAVNNSGLIAGDTNAMSISNTGFVLVNLEGGVIRGGFRAKPGGWYR